MENIKKLPSLTAGEAIKSVLSNLTNFKGRSRRSELWWYWLVYFLVVMVLALVLSPFPALLAIIAFLLQLTTWAVTVRRLHDRGHSGLWVAAAIIIGLANNIYVMQSGYYDALTSVNPDPNEAMRMVSGPVFIILSLLSFIVNITIFVFCVRDSKPEANKYGPSPKYVFDEIFSKQVDE